jgi:hypothetical protein
MGDVINELWEPLGQIDEIAKLFPPDFIKVLIPVCLVSITVALIFISISLAVMFYNSSTTSDSRTLKKSRSLLEVKRLAVDAKLPLKGSKWAAGFDLFRYIHYDVNLIFVVIMKKWLMQEDGPLFKLT